MNTPSDSDRFIVDVLPGPPGTPCWVPAIGHEADGLTLPTDARQRILSECQRILSRCVPPTGVASSLTGLVVGHVQSGKTTAFTTLAALARDNGFRMVIIIAGTNLTLFRQNRDRLVSALRLDSRPRHLPWRHISQPRLQDLCHNAITDTLSQWNSPTAMPAERRTLLISVMKHHQHLRNLNAVLRRVALDGVPTLIVDDEGDQAGLNTQVRIRRQSTTYSRILELKQLLPSHSYVQFTATPQAPLLINLVDVLSPLFAEVLTPGNGYVGGSDFFVSHPQLVRDIPPADIPTAANPLNAPPASLLEAMRLFFIAAAIGHADGTPEDNCSLMVHPSQRTDPHQQFFNWVARVRNEWLEVLDLPETDCDRSELLQLFNAAYEDLARTYERIPTWTTVVRHLRIALSQTEIREVNARGRRTPEINWGEAYSWILVGGQAMDRGFTVQGLTVTYMPRTVGLGNADTVQQRARFFGYKRAYLGLCRVFVGQDVRQAFHTYVDHEQDVRNEIRRFSETNRPLSEWRREFFLSRQLRPTRDNVIDIAYRRQRFGNDWVFPQSPHETADAVAINHAIFNEFRNTRSFVPFPGLDDRRDSPRNLMAEGVTLADVHATLLTRYRVTRIEDSRRLGALLRLIQLHLMHVEDEVCTVILMAEGRTRRRDYADRRIVQLFQGPQYAQRNNVQVNTYPGDRHVRADAGITLQLGYLNLGPLNGPMIAENVPHFAVWVPESMARDTLQQPQGGHG